MYGQTQSSTLETLADVEFKLMKKDIPQLETIQQLPIL